MTQSDELMHAALRAGLPELALGVLDGRERATLQAHVETCPACADELARYAETADELVHLAPGIEPPVGFESRTVERIAPQTIRAHRARRRTVALAAVAASVAAAFAFGWWASTVAPSRSAPLQGAGRLLERPLVGTSGVVGAAYVSSRSPTWMFVALSLPGHETVVRCSIVQRSGTNRSLGSFTLNKGSGGWGTSVPVSISSIKAVEISNTSGQLLARSTQGTWSYGSAQHGATHPMRIGAISSGA